MKLLFQLGQEIIWTRIGVMVVKMEKKNMMMGLKYINDVVNCGKQGKETDLLFLNSLFGWLAR